MLALEMPSTGNRHCADCVGAQGTGTVPTVSVHFRSLSAKFASTAGFKCVEALGRIIIRGPYPPSNAIIYNILWRPSLPCPPLNPALFARLTVVSRDQ